MYRLTGCAGNSSRLYALQAFKLKYSAIGVSDADPFISMIYMLTCSLISLFHFKW